MRAGTPPADTRHDASSPDRLILPLPECDSILEYAVGIRGVQPRLDQASGHRRFIDHDHRIEVLTILAHRARHETVLGRADEGTVTATASCRYVAAA
jgi:hypothetical protein